MKHFNFIMNRFKSFFSSQKTIFWYTVAILTLPCVMMVFTEVGATLTHLLRVALPLALYWLVMTLFKKPGKGFWWTFLFSFFAAFQIVLLYLFGESPVAVDMFLNVVTTNPTEVDELLSQIYLSVIFVFVVYGLGIGLSVVSLRSREVLAATWRRTQRRIAACLLGGALLLLGACYLTDRNFSLRDDIFPFNVAYNFGLSFDRLNKSANYQKNVADFSHHATSSRPAGQAEIYVLIIGETIRADNMSLYGYGHPTTPTLDSLEAAGQLAVYRDALTASNTTHKSVPALLTPVLSQHDFNAVYRQRGLISAFNEAGFSTVFYSNQRRNHSLIDFLGCEAREITFTKDSIPITANVFDEKLVDLLAQRIAHRDSTERMLVVLHTYGAHFDYRDRVPDGFGNNPKPFYPSATPPYREQLTQAYDNAVQYTDFVIGQVIGLIRKTGLPAVVAYTSDHGEDIYDDNRQRFLHASPIPTYYQLRVPLLFWASAQWTEKYPARWQAILSHRSHAVSTNAVLFHTMLDIAGIRTDHMRIDYALTDTRFTPARRLYINDHNELLPLDSCGLKQIDIDLFHRNNIKFP